MATFIRLADARLVAKGNKRSVYEHPDFPGMLVKVVRESLIDEAGQLKGQPLRRRLFKPRLGAFLAIDRELREFLVFSVRPGNRGLAIPIQRFHGFVETDGGLGLVVEKLIAPDGGLAPTVYDLIDQKRFTPEHRVALLRLFDDLARLHLCIGVLHIRNIVFVGEAGKGGRFIGVDGLGEKNLIPLAAWSKRFNDYQLHRRARNLLTIVDAKVAASTGNQTR